MKNLRLSIFRAGIKETETSHLRKMAITWPWRLILSTGWVKKWWLVCRVRLFIPWISVVLPTEWCVGSQGGKFQDERLQNNFCCIHVSLHLNLSSVPSVWRDAFYNQNERTIQWCKYNTWLLTCTRNCQSGIFMLMKRG
jgi:hypothetical protein